MADFKPKGRDKNVLDSKRVKLSMPCPVKGVTKGWSSLTYYANNDNPGITVYTGDPNDQNNNFGRIQAKFGLMDMMVHLEQLDAVVKSKDPISMTAVCKGFRGKDKPVVMPAAEVEVGKRGDGVVYIVVRDLEMNNRPEITFSFAPTNFHEYAINGVPCTEAQLSVLVAKGIIELMRNLIPMISKDTYKHPEPKQQNGGQGGGYNRGGGNGGGQGGGYNNNRGNGGGAPAGGGYNAGGDDDSDIPF